MVKNVNPFLPNQGIWMEPMKLDSNRLCATVSISSKRKVKNLGSNASSGYSIRRRGGKEID